MEGKEYKKMTVEALQGLLHMRTRGYTQKNKKIYTRKKKHKEKGWGDYEG